MSRIRIAVTGLAAGLVGALGLYAHSVAGSDASARHVDGPAATPPSGARPVGARLAPSTTLPQTESSAASTTSTPPSAR